MSGDAQPRRPTVFVIGGVPGAGKSTIARRLADDLRLPCLASDTIGETIRTSHGVRSHAAVDAYWIAYDVVFRLAEEFVGAGLSVVLDVNLGWQFQWDWLDAFPARQPDMQVLPILLCCSRDVCLERIHRRHANEPATAAPELYQTDPQILAVFSFLEHLEPSNAVVIDASRCADEVYASVRAIAARG